MRESDGVYEGVDGWGGCVVDSDEADEVGVLITSCDVTTSSIGSSSSTSSSSEISGSMSSITASGVVCSVVVVGFVIAPSAAEVTAASLEVVAGANGSLFHAPTFADIEKANTNAAAEASQIFLKQIFFKMHLPFKNSYIHLNLIAYTRIYTYIIIYFFRFVKTFIDKTCGA